MSGAAAPLPGWRLSQVLIALVYAATLLTFGVVSASVLLWHLPTLERDHEAQVQRQARDFLRREELLVRALETQLGITAQAAGQLGGPALTDLLGGHVEAMIASAGLVMTNVKNGRLTVLAVTSRERSSLVPGVPAVSEFVPHFEAQSWVGILAPAGTPRAVITRLNDVLRKAVAQPEARERFAQQGYEIVGSSPEQFGAWIRSESAKWGKIIRERGITAE